MAIFLKITKGNVIEAEISDFELFEMGTTKLYYKGFSPEEIVSVADAYANQSLPEYLNEQQVNFDTFFLVVIDQSDKKVEIYNDYFGSNELYYCKAEDTFYISDDIKKLFSASSLERKYRNEGIYEHIVFQTVLPPNTIYTNVFTLVMASYTIFDSVGVQSHIYWDIDHLLRNKNRNYEEIVELSRAALLRSLERQMKGDTAVALSGGIDSGGLLGMASSIQDKPLYSISVGGHGPQTIDLESARKSAEYNKTVHTEMYPSFGDLERLKKFNNGLNQPIVADQLLPYSMIHEKASEMGASGVIYGFGAEMLLGNLKIAKVGYMLFKFEHFLPQVILRPLYRMLVAFKKLSDTQRDFLLSFSWPERFMFARGALYVWEKKYFTEDQTKLRNTLKEKVSQSMMPETMDIIDRLAKAYIFSWVNYLQLKDFKAMSKQFHVTPIMPFDTPRLVAQFYSATNETRKKNKWNKMVIRDVMKPFVADHLYSNPVRSLIIPYSKVLKGKEERVIEYLKGSEILTGLIDFKKIEEELDSMPEPGLFLYRMLGLAVWHDVNWNQERIREFEKIFV